MKNTFGSFIIYCSIIVLYILYITLYILEINQDIIILQFIKVVI